MAANRYTAAERPVAPLRPGWALALANLPPIPPICWCWACHARPVAVRGPYSGRCARCRSVPRVPDLRPCLVAIPAHRRRSRIVLRLEREAVAA